MSINFYHFSSKGYLTTFAASPIDDADYTKGMRDNLPFGKYDGYSFPIVFREMRDASGIKLRDFLDTRYVSFYLISDRTVQLLQENGITGWKTYPIELYDKNGNRIEGYQGFSVIGSGGVLEGLEQWRTDSKTRKKFHLDQWDGSDFFSFYDTACIIVTERVRTLFKANKVDAVYFDPPEDSSIDVVPDERNGSVIGKAVKKKKKKEKPPQDSKGLYVWMTHLLNIGHRIKYARLSDAYINSYRERSGGDSLGNCLVSGIYPDWLPFPIPSFLLPSEAQTQLDNLPFTNNPYFIIVSKHLEDIFVEKGLTGWKTYPVTVSDEGVPVEAPYYRGLAVTGRGGAVIQEKRKVGKTRTKWIYSYDTKQWDGSDFFLVDAIRNGELKYENRYIMVSEKVRQLFKDLGIETIFNISSIDEWL